MVDRPAGLCRAGRRHVGVGHPAAPRGRAAARRAERGDPADLRHLEGCRRRAPGAERARHRGGEGEARQDQDQLRALDLDGRGAHRASGAHLQRPVQQPGAPDLRRAAPAPAGCEQRHLAPGAPEARHLAHHQRRRDLHRPRGRRREDVLHGRRDHGAAPARPHHQGDDDRARPLPGAGLARVPAALPEREDPGRRRDQLREGEAPALPRPGRHRHLGLHHHHPLGLQVHPGAGGVRGGADPGAAAELRRPAGKGRQRRPHHQEADRAHEGRARGQAGGARRGQGRHADHLGDRGGPDHRRRSAGVQEALVPDQHERPARRGAGRLAAGVGSLREVALRGADPAAAVADPGVGHADHQHARRDVHPAALHAAGRAGGARPARVRCLGVLLR